MQFHTSYKYTDRETKSRYVWLKYQSILKGAKILDVGADKCHLKKHLGEKASYWGIGLGRDADQQVNLEKERIPSADNTFDCVLCLDVLEHLDNIHAVFDDVCRVTKRHAIFSLPNPYAAFWRMIRLGDYRPGVPMKFYGLPLEPPEDRHKWFFSKMEAEKFILHRAAKSKMRILQIDHEGRDGEGSGWRSWLRVLARTILLRSDLDQANLYAGRLWAVLEKQQHSETLD